MKRLNFIAFLLLLCLSSTINAQQLGKTNTTASQIIIPFEKKGDLIMIKVGINNQSLLFVFDTGATTTVIDSAVAAQIKLQPTGSQQNTSAGGISTFKYINDQQITISAHTNITCGRIIFANLQALKERIGVDFGGIIGFDLLNKFITKIDYDTKTISFDTETGFIDSNYTAIPFKFANGIVIPQFEISISLNNGKKLSGRILFDSGASLNLFVNTPFKIENQLLTQLGKTVVSKSHDLFKENITDIARIQNLRIGTYTLNDLPISLSSATEGVNSYPGYLGILGSKVIQRFNIILDYSKKILYLKPNSLFNVPFEFPMSGFTLKKVNNEILISDVFANSEAEEKGFKSRQKIISIDGYKGNDMEILKNLLQQEGKTIQISVLADGKINEMSLTLKKLI